MTPVSRVLLVDDDRSLSRALGISLRARGYEVDVAHSGEEALDLAAHRHPDAVLLDLGLPGVDGIEFLEALRGWSEVPVIVLSARDRGSVKVAALDAGADDYVTKPFAMDELLARLRAALRRGGRAEFPEQAVVPIEVGSIDLVAKRAVRDGEPVRLTPKEWEIVELLVRNPGRLVPQRQILQQVWGPEYGQETDYLRVHLARIRRKLERLPSHPRHFRTEPGMGYRFEP